MSSDNNNAKFFVKCAICKNIIEQTIRMVNEHNLSKLEPGTIICQSCQYHHKEETRKHLGKNTTVGFGLP